MDFRKLFFSKMYGIIVSFETLKWFLLQLNLQKKKNCCIFWYFCRSSVKFHNHERRKKKQDIQQPHHHSFFFPCLSVFVHFTGFLISAGFGYWSSSFSWKQLASASSCVSKKINMIRQEEKFFSCAIFKPGHLKPIQEHLLWFHSTVVPIHAFYFFQASEICTFY